MSQLSAIAGVPVAEDVARYDQAIGTSVVVDPDNNLYATSYAGLATGIESVVSLPLAKGYSKSKTNLFVNHKANKFSRGSFAAASSVMTIEPKDIKRGNKDTR